VDMPVLEFKKREMMEQQVEIFCAFGEGPGRGETSAGGNVSCRVSHGRDRQMSKRVWIIRAIVTIRKFAEIRLKMIKPDRVHHVQSYSTPMIRWDHSS
jgi:hypothetical protein